MEFGVVHVFVAEGRYEGNPALGPRYRDVEAALAAVVEERAEAVDQPTCSILPVADREDDRVTLITLDALEVLDEEGLLSFAVVLGVEEFVELGLLLANLIEPGLDATLMAHAHRDNAKRLVRPHAGVLEDELDDPLHLGGGTQLLA